MKAHKTKEIATEIFKSITCDFCGTTYDCEEWTDTLEYQEFFCVDAVGGYASVFGDGVEIKFDMCQYCLLKLVAEKENGEFRQK